MLPFANITFKGSKWSNNYDLHRTKCIHRHLDILDLSKLPYIWNITESYGNVRLICISERVIRRLLLFVCKLAINIFLRKAYSFTGAFKGSLTVYKICAKRTQHLRKRTMAQYDIIVLLTNMNHRIRSNPLFWLVLREYEQTMRFYFKNPNLPIHALI